MKMYKTLIYTIIFFLANQSYAQNQINEYDYGKLLFNSYPTYDMIIDIGENKFVVPIVTSKKQALLDCFTFDLNQVYSKPFQKSTISKNDKSLLITSFHKGSKTLYALRSCK